MTQKPSIKEQAIMLAKANKEAEPNIIKIYWFKDTNEIRLVETDDTTIPSTSYSLEPFYFQASPKEGIFYPSSVAIIRSDECQKIKLPVTWGSWDDAEELQV